MRTAEIIQSNKYDPTGHFGIWALIAITAASMLIGGTAQLVSNAMAGKTGSELWRGVAGAAVGAGVNALALCLAMPTGGASLFIAAGTSAIAQTGVDTLETIIRGEEVDVGQTFIDLGLNLFSFVYTHNNSYFHCIIVFIQDRSSMVQRIHIFSNNSKSILKRLSDFFGLSVLTKSITKLLFGCCLLSAIPQFL